MCSRPGRTTARQPHNQYGPASAAHHKHPHAGLLNVEAPDFVAGLVAALHKDFQKSLAAADTDRARMLLRLAAALTAVNVVQPGSFLAALHSLADSALAAVQPGDAQTGGPRAPGAASRITAETGQMVEHSSGQSCKSDGMFQCSPAMLFACGCRHTSSQHAATCAQPGPHAASQDLPPHAGSGVQHLWSHTPSLVWTHHICRRALSWPAATCRQSGLRTTP